MNSNEGSADAAAWQLRLCRRSRRKGECLWKPQTSGGIWEAGQRAGSHSQENREMDPRWVPGLFGSDCRLYFGKVLVHRHAGASPRDSALALAPLAAAQSGRAGTGLSWRGCQGCPHPQPAGETPTTKGEALRAAPELAGAAE